MHGREPQFALGAVLSEPSTSSLRARLRAERYCVYTACFACGRARSLQKHTVCTQHVLRAEGLVRRRKILCIHSMFSVRRARSPTKGSCVYTIPFLKFTPVRGTVGCRRDPFVEER